MAFLVSSALFLLIVGCVVWLGYRRWLRPGALLNEPAPPGAASSPAPRGFYTVAAFAERVGSRVPPPPENASRYMRELYAAGHRSPEATTIFYGLKLTLAAVFLVCGFLLRSRIPLPPVLQFAYVLVAAWAGFRLPDFFLARRVKDRRRRLRRGLPDALDLLIVCAEAGSAVDRSIRIVAREIELAHPELSDELNLMLGPPWRVFKTNTETVWEYKYTWGLEEPWTLYVGIGPDNRVTGQHRHQERSGPSGSKA